LTLVLNERKWTSRVGIEFTEGKVNIDLVLGSNLGILNRMQTGYTVLIRSAVPYEIGPLYPRYSETFDSSRLLRTFNTFAGDIRLCSSRANHFNSIISTFIENFQLEHRRVGRHSAIASQEQTFQANRITASQNLRHENKSILFFPLSSR
jgi:hypothetical protein